MEVADHATDAATGAGCRLGRLLHGYRPKMTALRMAWKGFAQRDDEQMAAFRQFVAEQGDSLFWQAAFDALHAQQVKEDEMRWGWPAWPEMYQNVDSPEVRQFCEEHRDDVDFISGCSGWLTASLPPAGR